MTHRLNPKRLWNIANRKERLHPDLSRLAPSAKALQEYLQKDKPSLLYGIDTGFGPHAFLNNEDRLENQRSLVYHLTVVSSKEFLKLEEARAVLAARISVLGLGASAVDPSLCNILLDLLEKDCIPKIPLRGSLSASGDLIPLSSIALALMGENEWIGQNAHMGPSLANQKKSAIQGLPRVLQAKEALSITNGTSFTTALLALQSETIRLLLEEILSFLEILFSFHPVFPDAFLPEYHKTKEFPGPIYVAERLYAKAKQNPKQKKVGSKIQDIYSVRCIPQILGSLFDEVREIQNLVEKELNSVSDNPIYIHSENRFAEGGNFYASHVSFAADRLQNVIAVLATWLERFMQYLQNPQENGQFTLSLSPEPGRYAGLSGLALLSTHLTSEIRRDSMPGSVQSLATNGGNQDIVPMGAISIYRNRRTIDDLIHLAAIFSYHIFQAGSLVSQEMSQVSAFSKNRMLKEDRDLREEINLCLCHYNSLLYPERMGKN
ncbi:aromatic amino acid lyase [Leptospira ryugenii]|uniref:Aromatic amino acid lyase n=1 Tax=Leptospira ryugenii TaxID=1917863 RepID=A0A2P2DXJ5_9LEPT|nr:aromatic amino acid ammonia-lyase [Leptospira ryugenii]GBF49342.1 aromatic amino acid lyase [Leptospira ryugenii]